MIAYLDASVILRIILGEADPLVEWPRIDRGVSSALAEVECLRTLDRLRTLGGLTEPQATAARATVAQMVHSMEIVEVSGVILSRATQPLPTPLGTLDAIHLATARLWGEHFGEEITFATHDRALARAARAVSLGVIGA